MSQKTDFLDNVTDNFLDKSPGNQTVNLLNKNNIFANLSDRARKDIQLIECFEQIDSTNSYLLREIKTGVCVCLAESQTAGRGRHGKEWQSPFAEHLYMSIAYPFEHASLSGLSLVIGLALIRVLEKQGIADPKLKWPNDLIVDNKKIAGILIELSPGSQGHNRAVIGIGMNVKINASNNHLIDQAWDGIERWISKPCDRNQLAATILNEVLEVLSIFAVDGFSAFCTQWKKYDILAGRAISYWSDSRQHWAHAMGVDERGALLVLKDGQETVLLNAERIRLQD